MSHIVGLKAENYKRLKAVELAVEGDNVVVVSGKNAQGKSSVLDAITAALSGVDSNKTPRPIREGADKAQIVLETDDLVITRKFTPAGSQLKVQGKDGATYTKGQAKLDQLIGKLSLDPLAFTRLSDKDQKAQLLELVELPFDPEALETDRAEIFTARSDVNRALKALGALPPVNEDMPVVEVSASEILRELRAAQEEKARQERTISESESIRSRVWELQEQIDVLQKEADQLAHRESELVERIRSFPQVADVGVLEQQLGQVEDTNARIRENDRARETVGRAAQLSETSEAHTLKLAEIDQRKTDGLAAADMPVPGLSFDEDGITYQGVPFKQASSAEQIRVSLAMSMALNPGLRVIRIADASLLDSESLNVVEQMAREHDFQVWLEMVDETGAFGFVIEDGELL